MKTKDKLKLKREKARERARKWRALHPKEWALIQARSRERARRKKAGVEVELAI